jgi:hypothetical protein
MSLALGYMITLMRFVIYSTANDIIMTRIHFSGAFYCLRLVSPHLAGFQVYGEGRAALAQSMLKAICLFILW